jgi:hypothetical protein
MENYKKCLNIRFEEFGKRQLEEKLFKFMANSSDVANGNCNCNCGPGNCNCSPDNCPQPYNCNCHCGPNFCNCNCNP